MYKGILAAFIAYTLWGILPIYWKLLDRISPDQVLANRIIWSFVFVALIIIGQGRWKEVNPFRLKKDNLLLYLCGIIISFNWFIFIYAVFTNHIVEASLGYYINPLLTIFLARIVLKEKLTGLQGVAVALAAAGVAVLTFSHGSLPIISLTLALTFSVYGLMKKKIQIEALPGLTLETFIVLPLAIGYLVFLQTKGQLVYPSLVAWEWILLLGTGVVTAVPLLLFAFSTRIIPLTTVGFIQYLSPTISLLIGVFIYKEPFTVHQAIAFSFIWVAIIIYSCTQMKDFSRDKSFKSISKKQIG